jgi:hypothetical protein
MRRVLSLLLLCAVACAAHAMDFRRVGDTLIMSGPVVGDDLARLRDQLVEPGIKLVLLHDSPGGDLWNGYQLGYRIHSAGLPTAVSGKCESACALIFLSGSERSFSDGRAPTETMVGLHGAHAIGSHQALPELAPRMAWVIRTATGSKYPDDLLKRTVYPHDPDDMVYAFFPGFYPRQAAARGVMQCLRQADTSFKCTMIEGLDALGIGLITNPEILHLPQEVKDALKDLS